MPSPFSKQPGAPLRRWLVAAVVSSLPLAGFGLSTGAQADPGDPPGTIRTIAGSNRSFAQGGFYGDGGPAVQAQLYDPRAFTFAPTGDLYIADSLNERIRKIDPQGNITTFAGNPTPDANGNPTPCVASSTNTCGDGGPASKAGFNEPHGIAMDSKGNIYVSDSQNNRIRRIDPSGTITLFAGTGLKTTPPGDNVPLAQAGIQDPKQMMIVNDVLYFCDTAHNMIRSIDLKAASPVVKNVAGSIQSKRYGGDGGPANQANLNSPKGMFEEPDGSMLISDTDNNLIRKITPDGTIRTIAGDVNADGFWVLQPQNGQMKSLTLRVPYPLGFHARHIDGRIDDPNAGWKGRGMWTSYSMYTPWHQEGGKGSRPKVVKLQMRPNPLAK